MNNSNASPAFRQQMLVQSRTFVYTADNTELKEGCASVVVTSDGADSR